MAEFEHLACPVCGKDVPEEHIAVPDRFAVGGEDLFRLCRCSACGMVYLNPRPTELESGRYYRHEEYLPFSSTKQKQSFLDAVYGRVRKLNLHWKRSVIEHAWRGGTAKRPGSLLDVGCGTGEFLATARKAGWQVTGLERDAEAAEWARTRLGLTVHTGDLAALPEPEKPFDIITMWHVLEHLYDPRGALRRLHGLLRSEGLLLIALPNVDSIDARIYRRHWIAYDTPRHVSHFSSRSLLQLVTEEGFRPVGRRQLPFDAAFNTLMSEQLDARRKNASAISWPFRMIRAGLTGLASLAGGSSLFGARYGATLVALFRKSSP